MSSRTKTPPGVIWHDLECGSYGGDLELWGKLAAQTGGGVLELGVGTGRVALSLARAGHAVTGLDEDPVLIAELERRARDARLTVDGVRADCRDFALGRRFGLIAAPMQLVHLLGGAGGRVAMLACAARHIAPGGCVAVSLLAAEAARPQSAGHHPPLPDVDELDGWVYSSLPIEIAAAAGGLEVKRLRQVVSPDGDLEEELASTFLDDVSVERLERDAAAAGLRCVARREVEPTPDHVGSTVLLLEAG